ncbi:hypothetical protein BDV18DRAFT_157570 [Aspergillus unguis]
MARFPTSGYWDDQSLSSEDSSLEISFPFGEAEVDALVNEEPAPGHGQATSHLVQKGYLNGEAEPFVPGLDAQLKEQPANGQTPSQTPSPPRSSLNGGAPAFTPTTPSPDRHTPGQDLPPNGEHAAQSPDQGHLAHYPHIRREHLLDRENRTVFGRRPPSDMSIPDDWHPIVTLSAERICGEGRSRELSLFPGFTIPVRTRDPLAEIFKKHGDWIESWCWTTLASYKYTAWSGFELVGRQEISDTRRNLWPVPTVLITMPAEQFGPRLHLVLFELLHRIQVLWDLPDVAVEIVSEEVREEIADFQAQGLLF